MLQAKLNACSRITRRFSLSINRSGKGLPALHRWYNCDNDRCFEKHSILNIPSYNRMSMIFLPTQKASGASKNTRIPTGDLLLQAGFIRQTASGIFSLLPMGQRVIEKLVSIIDQEMKNIGGQRMTLPTVLPIEPWVLSTRYEKMEGDLFKLSDRKGASYILGPTHEEEITRIVANENISYRKLPLRLYQITSKFRDEKRPRSLLLRGREFLMKDMYTFDATEADALISYKKALSAYHRIFERIGVPYAIADADSGDIGGPLSQEFHIFNQDGEDTILQCENCGYVANEEKAVGVISNSSDISFASISEWLAENSKTSLNFSISVYIKSSVDKGSQPKVVTESSPDLTTVNVFIAPPGRKVNPAKCKSAFGSNGDLLGEQAFDTNESIAFSDLIKSINNAVVVKAQKLDESETRHPDYKIRYFVDPQSANGSENSEMLSKAFEIITSSLVAKSIPESAISIDTQASVRLVDLVTVEKHDNCKKCTSNNLTSKLISKKAIEIGHIFYLGTKYSSLLNAQVLLKSSSMVPIQMGCYGIGVMRSMQATADAARDDKGLIWPLSISPYSVYILPLLPKSFLKSKPGISTFDQLVESNTNQAENNKTDSDSGRETTILINGINKIAETLELHESKIMASRQPNQHNFNQRLFDSHNIVLDDRFHLSPGYKLYDSEMLGVPFTVILGADFFSSNGLLVELRFRKFKNAEKAATLDTLPKAENQAQNESIYRKVPIDQLASLIFSLC